MDCIFQSIIIIATLLLLTFYPQYAWIFGVVAVAVLLSWQILHAWYVVHKHSDWQRSQYLFLFRRLMGYSLLTVGVGGLMGLISLGALMPFVWFMCQIVGLVTLAALVVLVLYAVFISFNRLYQYYHRPRSFWDLK